MADEATCTHIDEVELCPTEPTAVTVVPAVTYPANVCEPGTYPASVAAVGDASQCVAIDPCGADGTTYWNANACTVAPVAFVGVATLPATGPTPYGSSFGVAGAVAVMFGVMAVRVARR